MNIVILSSAKANNKTHQSSRDTASNATHSYFMHLRVTRFVRGVFEFG